MSYFIERRRHYRISKEIKVRYKFIIPGSNPKEEEFYEATTKNISTTGVLLRAKIPYPELLGEMMLKRVLLYLEIILMRANAVIKATAQLRWAESVDVNNNIYHIGLKFVDMTADDKNTLTEFILNNI